MSIDINGIAHIQLTVKNAASIEFWRALCGFMSMSTLIDNEDVHYSIGGRTGVLVRLAPIGKRSVSFDQDTSGLHHVCFRARSRRDVELVFEFVSTLRLGKIVHPPEEGGRFAPGYYSILFEDPDGIRIEVNFVPGSGHFSENGRLGSGGVGPANNYGEEGLTNK
ncbi:MAG TPA: bleomycin resistance protein [Betaproteobacteria bacterium]|mgnify:CR=1 FL=1|jgi:catechol 2,3-dioxygenase-like lactoylglutathione lyase family enzyme|nr:VOC family protein [Burkholderiales bacterium]HBZ19259.1 bleomycin resistance protein [Betaproteobacteria bacterium]